MKAEYLPRHTSDRLGYAPGSCRTSPATIRPVDAPD
jgi:hypothetical protein